jgi:hypothetical protein
VFAAVSSVGQKWTSELQTTRPPTATRGCIDTICLSWWWARWARNMDGVKNKNKYIEENCVSRWSFTKNHCMMYGQQNVKTLLVAGSLVCAISANHVSCIYLSQYRDLHIRVFILYKELKRCNFGSILRIVNQLDALSFSNIFICLTPSTCFGHYVPIIRRDPVALTRLLYLSFRFSCIPCEHYSSPIVLTRYTAETEWQVQKSC